MRFIIPTQEFNYLISKCFNVIPTKATVPILANFLLEAKDGILTVTSTDLTVSIRCFTEVQVLEEGVVLLPAKRLFQLVRELTSANIEISIKEGGGAEIIADSSHFRLPSTGKAGYPQLPDLSESVSFAIKQVSLKDVLFRTAFAVSREDNRFALTGIFLQIAGKQATFIGTDGKRLARSYLAIDIDDNYSGSFIIPLKAIDEILKNLSESETNEAKFFLMPDKIAVQTSDTIIVTKLLVGEYPDVNRVIPAVTEQTITLHREELMILLRQVALFTTEDNPAARFSFLEGELRLFANTMEVGEGKVSMAVNYYGPHLEIAFNPHFFLDILKHSKGEAIVLGVNDSYNPGVLTYSDQVINRLVSIEASPLFVLMPMRLNEE